MYTVVLHRRLDHRHFGMFIGKDIPGGFYVVTVEPDSPAADANIQPGDHVVAINGQLLSSMPENTTDMIVRITNQAESLTLALRSSDILKLAGLYSINYHQKYASEDKGGLENSLRLVLHDNIKITPVLSSNQNEYILSYRPSKTRHGKRKRHLKSRETQTSFADEEFSTPRRIIPSMGTSHIILRNAQSTPKDPSEIKSTPPINDFGWPSYTPPQQQQQPPPISSSQLNEENLRSMSGSIGNSSSSSSSSSVTIDDGLHEVHLHRSPNYPGFGFHLQYNRVYYLVHQIELNSPAERSGLRVGDIILRVNGRPTDAMPHHILVDHITGSNEVVFQVQPIDKFLRENPEFSTPNKERMASTKEKTVKWKNENLLSKAISKLKSL